MPTFRYKAAAYNGDIKEGEMEESDAAAVIRHIQETRRIPIFAEEVRPGLQRLDVRRWRVEKKGVGRREVASFTRSMASLLSAGTPLDRALEIMRDVEDDALTIRLIDDVQQSVRGGGSLSFAVAEQGDLFSRFYVSMLRAAEASGNLSSGLERLVDYLDRRQEIHDRVVSALIYPVILLLVAGLSVIVLLSYVVPQFRSMFDDMGPALPVATRVVLAVSDFITSFGWLGIPIIALTLVYARKYVSKPENRLRLDNWLLHTPLIGALIRNLETARLSRSLGTLLQSGVPVLNSLSIARDSLSNRVMVDEIDKAIISLKQGGQLASTLVTAKRFPKLAIQLIRVGEETGSLDKMMLHIAAIYDREVNSTIHRLLALLEPALIISLGVVIATIIMSILVGIVSINDLPF